MSTSLKPGITAVVLAKGDAAQLERCLKSIQPVVASSIVVDPGFGPGTEDIAKKNGSKCHRAAWQKAYDVVLNEGLDLVETEWTLRMNSDEWLDDASVEEFSKVTEIDNGFLAVLLRIDHLPEDKTSQSEENRLWRTHPEMRYGGRVFEQIWPEALAKAAQGRGVIRTGIKIHSDANLSPNIQERAEHNLELIDLELEDRPGRLFYRVCRADTLRILEREAEAREEFDAVVDDIVRKNQAPEDLMAVMVIARSISEIKEEDLHTPRSGKLLKYALQWLGEFPPVVWTAMEFERRRGNLRAAYNLLRQLDAMGRSNRFSRALGFNPAIVREAAWAGILEIAPKIGKEEVVPQYQRLLYQSQRMRS